MSMRGAVTLCPTDTDGILRALMDRGFRFIHPRDAAGEVITVVGIRAHGPVIDVIRLDAEDSVSVLRLPGDETDVLNPRRVLWKREGTLVETVTELLALSDDAHVPAALAPNGGCWVPGAPGRQKWLAATA